MKKRLFISYAHKDGDVLKALESHLNSVSKRESYHNFLDVFIVPLGCAKIRTR